MLFSPFKTLFGKKGKNISLHNLKGFSVPSHLASTQWSAFAFHRPRLFINAFTTRDKCCETPLAQGAMRLSHTKFSLANTTLYWEGKILSFVLIIFEIKGKNRVMRGFPTQRWEIWVGERAITNTLLFY